MAVGYALAKSLLHNDDYRAHQTIKAGSIVRDAMVGNSNL